jgi:hypothetical protein
MRPIQSVFLEIRRPWLSDSPGGALVLFFIY